ncbi:DtxR family iron (metal) dependent repressor [Halanaerobium saccharolyticum]|uniref:DtxR family iron (Metal) dependent repressor n=1 Tax=Halanaerobium saccharolyticum TaxID=43595 RepID=A0A4R7Z8T1_9FIRM|nr:DtxR family transcriptional regulator [Halanaerobium saccharolyticum]RAK11816.1 DtxR family iron (metal) dependent repressor [Halanaerobium saccharolyticum]TDW07657.1 DtxR family iron (metal) dependent repressor [Halanaerobium saccharolyticum]TDX64578.1 DtxR family iron (metal) dependent repressor [Halanaerobium saccharolyticum]
MEAKITLSESMEDYLEAIFNLIKENGSARVTDIANSLGIAASSVNQGLKKLNEQGLIKQQKYGPIKLTQSGVQAAEKVNCKHQILYLFLHKTLGVEPETADQDACSIEHVLSQQSFEKMVDYLIENNYIEEQNCAFKFMENEEEEKMAAKEFMLDSMSVGSKAEVLKIESKGRLKRKLMDMGLNRGARVEVKGKAPMGDPIEIKVRGYSLSLRQDEAAEILVKEV